jgi:hypothetical protein
LNACSPVSKRTFAKKSTFAKSGKHTFNAIRWPFPANGCQKSMFAKFAHHIVRPAMGANQRR